ncbi:hypothetical protein [Burkholderia phage FLC9]|nr:hypothetical protein [Burkholderia phage FLC9]
MSSETTKGLTFEEAHNAKPVGYIFESVAITNTNPPQMQKFITLGERQNATDVNVYTEDVVATLKGQVAELQEQLSGHKTAYENMRTRYEAERLRQFTEPGWFFPASWISEGAAKSLNDLIENAKRVSITDVTCGPTGKQFKYEGDWIKYGYEVKPADMPLSAAEKEFRKHLCAALGLNAAEVNDERIITEVMQKVAEATPILGEDRVSTLFDAIKHGDEAHRAWLKEAIDAHFAGQAVPPVVMKSGEEQSWVVKLGAAVARYHEPIVINGVKMDKLDEIYKRLMKNVGMPESRSLLQAFQQLTIELTQDSAKLHDIVQLVCGHMEASKVWWGTPRDHDTTNPYALKIDDPVLGMSQGGGTQPAKVEPRLGKQAGISYYKNGRLYLYNMGDTVARQDVEFYPVYFEEGKMPPEMSPTHTTKDQVSAADVGEVMRSWVVNPLVITPSKDMPYQNARKDLDCTACPMQAVLEGCCKEIRSSTDGGQHEYEFELNKYTDMLNATLDAYCSESIFKTSPEYMEKLKASIREHYLSEWKRVNAPLFVGGETQPQQYTEAQLADPTLLQKAIVMGMAGDQKQQDEARNYLTQYLAITTRSQAAASAYLKL